MQTAFIWALLSQLRRQVVVGLLLGLLLRIEAGAFRAQNQMFSSKDKGGKDKKETKPASKDGKSAAVNSGVV